MQAVHLSISYVVLLIPKVFADDCGFFHDSFDACAFEPLPT